MVLTGVQYSFGCIMYQYLNAALLYSLGPCTLLCICLQKRSCVNQKWKDLHLRTCVQSVFQDICINICAKIYICKTQTYRIGGTCILATKASRWQEQPASQQPRMLSGRDCLHPSNQGHRVEGATCILATKTVGRQEPLPSQQPRTLDGRSCLHSSNQGCQVIGGTCIPATNDTRWQEPPASQQLRTLGYRSHVHLSN